MCMRTEIGIGIGFGALETFLRERRAGRETASVINTFVLYTPIWPPITLTLPFFLPFSLSSPVSRLTFALVVPCIHTEGASILFIPLLSHRLFSKAHKHSLTSTGVIFSLVYAFSLSFASRISAHLHSPPPLISSSAFSRKFIYALHILQLFGFSSD